MTVCNNHVYTMSYPKLCVRIVVVASRNKGTSLDIGFPTVGTYMCQVHMTAQDYNAS
jgi:hypothetical protein